MLEIGEYKILQIINISESLLSQTENEPEQKGIYKAVAECNGKSIVLYFVDCESFGQNSVIKTTRVLNKPILKPEDFKILLKKEYIHSCELVEHLLKITSK